MHVVVVGAGIGGLSCAIACRRANPPLQVTVLERVPEILTIGAGIHVPPNATKVLTEFGLLEKLKAAKAHVQQYFRLRRWEDGRTISEREIGARAAEEYGAEWLVLQRGDYQELLVQAALRLGVKIMVGANVIGIESKDDGKEVVQLKDGTTVEGDVVIGADGLWSTTRNLIFSKPINPRKLGHVAFRATFSRDDVKGLQSERLERMMEQADTQVWLGFGKHVVFYPLRNHEQFNLVFIVTDEGAAQVPESFNPLQELRANFQNWDPILMQIISVMKGGLKWQLYHVDELDTWTKGATALLGDACHPSLPYQGQGAAMAVEDGAVLGVLLGSLQAASEKSGYAANPSLIANVLKLYESIRKRRSQDNVDGALHNGYYYHLPDGEEQEKRDRELEILASQGWKGKCSFNWGDAEYQQKLLGFDVLKDAEDRFTQWWETRDA